MRSSLDLDCLPLVLDYLSFSDIKAVRLVCRKWCDAIVSTPRYFNNAVINITGTLNRGHATNQLLEEQYKYLNNSKVTDLVKSVCFRNAGRRVTGFTDGFWSTFGPQIMSLKFQSVVFETDGELEHALSLCKNLTELRFENCVSLSSHATQAGIPFRLDKLEGISFVRCNFSEYMYNRLQENTSPIRWIEFENCFVRSEDAARNVLSIWTTMVKERSRHNGSCIDVIQPFILQHAQSLTSLVLNKIAHIDIPLDIILSANGLSLKKFHFKAFDQETAESTFGSLMAYQPTIEDVAFDAILVFDYEAVKNISERLNTLRNLSLTVEESELDLILGCLSEMNNLNSLEIFVSPTVDITWTTNFTFNCESFPSGLRVLKCFDFTKPWVGVDMLVPTFPVRITELHLSGCRMMVDDLLLQNIFKFMLVLQVLDLFGCYKVTDAGIVGNSSINGDRGDGFPISRLKNLRVLNLSGCNQITDITLQKGLFFNELRELDLSNCFLSHVISFTDEAIGPLGAQIPSLEVFRLPKCLVSDEGLAKFLEHAPRLKALDLMHCQKFTLSIIKSIAECCPLMTSIMISCLPSLKAAFDILKDKLPRCAITDHVLGRFENPPINTYNDDSDSLIGSDSYDEDLDD